MPETKYERDLHRFDSLGMDLNRPVDSVKNNKYPILVNMRRVQSGRLETRDGLTQIAAVVAGQATVHSARRLNDPATADYTRILGAGTHVAWGKSSFTDVDSGYSGDPLALVPWRPEASPTAFMYIGDRSRMRKVGVAGALHTVGLAAPNAPPGVDLTTATSYKTVDDFFAAGPAWVAVLPANPPSLLNWRVNTTIDKILYDTGSTGWATVVPVVITNIGQGTDLDIQTEVVTVQLVTPGFAATTISRIIYDDAVTGLCSLVLATPVNGVAVDSFIYNSDAGVIAAGNSKGRIVAVTEGPDGNVSLRVQTPQNVSWSINNAVQILPSFRTYLPGVHAAGDYIQANGMRSAITVGTGTLTRAPAVMDLSSITAGVATKPDDYMHISIRISDPTVVTEIKVLLDVDAGLAYDFTKNYYWKSFRPSDLTAAAANQQSLLQANQTSAQRTVVQTILVSNISQSQANKLFTEGIITEPIVASEPNTWSKELQDLYATPTTVYVNEAQQMNPGNSQWAEMRFRLSDLIRVGTDASRTLRDVNALRITIIATGSLNLDVGSWWIGGGSGPDTGDATAQPYYYRYRARNISTNVASNCSPPSRYQALPLRQKVTITPAQYAAPTGTSLATTDFVLDIERFGGSLPDWHYIGTATNGATPTFADTLPDDVAAGNPLLGNENYQPWPVIGLPVSGTTGTVAGTTINDVGAAFSTSWAPGTRILIANTPYTIYRVISTSRLELIENAGAQTTQVWRIDAPTLLAQPLACLWEHQDTFFACGDPTNPGRLYYSNAGSETTRISNYLDLSGPSEPLMNGLSYNIRSYVFSSENLFQGLPTGNALDPWRYERIPNGKGLFSRWALTREPSPVIAFLAKDGINITTGGASQSITDDDLYPFFPTEGNPGVSVNGLYAPDIISTQAANLRLTQYDGYLYFDFIDIAPVPQRATLLCVLNPAQGEGPAWYYDAYTPGIVFHYGEEGSGVHSILCGGPGAPTGFLFQFTGLSDQGTPINCHFRTPSVDQGDPRLNKLYGDIMLDCDAAGVSITCTPGTNNHSTTYTPVVVSNSGRAQTAIALGSSWPTAKNISLDVQYLASTSARPVFYIWEPRWTFESAPVSALSWEISPSTLGMENFKHIGICKITHVSTADISFIVIVDGVSQSTITIPNSGGLYTQTIFRTPVYKGKLIKFRILSTTEFRLDGRDSFIEIKDWGSDGPYNRMRVFGDYSLVEG